MTALIRVIRVSAVIRSGRRTVGCEQYLGLGVVTDRVVIDERIDAAVAVDIRRRHEFEPVLTAAGRTARGEHSQQQQRQDDEDVKSDWFSHG
jgi:hypothetical protein